jgi:hypothetical protein
MPDPRRPEVLEEEVTRHLPAPADTTLHELQNRCGGGSSQAGSIPLRLRQGFYQRFWRSLMTTGTPRHPPCQPTVPMGEPIACDSTQRLASTARAYCASRASGS